MEISGKTALVTGACGALGSAICSMLKDSGIAKVYAVDINEDALKRMAGGPIEPYWCDISNPAAVEQCLKNTPEIDILINNAGILHSAPLVNIMNKDENRFVEASLAWQQVVGTNLSSAFYVTQQVADRMVRSRIKGVIVNISSISAAGTPGQSAYAAAKAGLDALTNVWAKELGPLGIRTVAVAPGYTDTPSTHKALTANQLETITGRIPLKKLGEVEHILQAVRFAIENDYVNGTVLEIDGGLVV